MTDELFFFQRAFAQSGEVEEIPLMQQTNGLVSFETGYGFDYERNPQNDPLSKEIERAKMNWLFKVITRALHQYQTVGHFPYITPEMNGGTAFSYALAARCLYDAGKGMALYESLVDNNTAPPTDKAKWRHVTGGGSAYELGEFYYFRHPTLRAGFQPAHGGVITGAATKYPEAWAYLQTVEGQLLCKTEAEWQAMTQATWTTLADGTKVGWNGIGGAPWYVQDLNAGTLRVPDIRGMYVEAAGFDGLGMGGVHGDGVRNVTGIIQGAYPGATGVFAQGSYNGYLTDTSGGSIAYNYNKEFILARSVPTANKNQPRAWGALACVYLGTPVS